MLRTVPYQPITETLAAHGLRTTVDTSRTYPQRLFTDERELRYAIDAVRALGGDPAGHEEAGRFHCLYYESRPDAQDGRAAALPGGVARGHGRRYRGPWTVGPSRMTRREEHDMADTPAPDRDSWRALLDELTEAHSGDLVTIEVENPSIGHQHEAERLPFSYLAYDPKDDAVVVGVGGRPPGYPVVLRHIVTQPKEVDVSTCDVPQPVVRVVDVEDTATLITFFPGDSGTESSGTSS